MRVEVPERGQTLIDPTTWNRLRASATFWQLVERKILAVSATGDGGARLTGASQVGRALCSGIQLEVVEKIPGALRALLRQNHSSLRILSVESAPTDLGELIALIVENFIVEARSYVTRGRQWSYVVEVGKSPIVGGRLRILDSIRLRARGARHLVAFDRRRINHNTALNRLIYQALREVDVLAKLDIAAIETSQSRSIGGFFEDLASVVGVNPSPWTAADREALLNEINGTGNEQMALLAFAVLSHQSFEVDSHTTGAAIPLTWFVNLENLFEVALRRSLAKIVAGAHWPRGNLSFVFPDASRLFANPDLRFQLRDDRVIIGDCKYKGWAKYSEASDLYQLLVHAATYEAVSAFLVYPSTELECEFLGDSAGGIATWRVAVNLADINGSVIEMCHEMGIPVTDDSGSWASSAANRKSMRANKSRDTAPELALRSAVHALGLRYRVSARPIKSVRRTADLVFPSQQVAVFLDGCFWHGCPEHHTLSATNTDYWREKVGRNRQRDSETDQLLSDNGWTSIRVWEHEDVGLAATAIADFIQARKDAMSRAGDSPPERQI